MARWSRTSVRTEPSAATSMLPDSTMLISAVARTARAFWATASAGSRGAPAANARARARNKGERIIAGSMVMK
ncbi:hypothetical protein [Stenotrophomonas pavanii]|uniref:hypothetical protein n=1 Tax=Stenotrophomonas pavanii TaxID=487698 RepID=UPI004048CF1B